MHPLNNMFLFPRSTCCHMGQNTTSFSTYWRRCWSMSLQNASVFPLPYVIPSSCPSITQERVKSIGTAVTWADDPE